MCDLVDKILQASEGEIQDIFSVVLERYAELFPDWEVSTISLQRGSDRNEQIDKIVGMLQKMKTSS